MLKLADVFSGILQQYNDGFTKPGQIDEV